MRVASKAAGRLHLAFAGSWWLRRVWPRNEAAQTRCCLECLWIRLEIAKLICRSGSGRRPRAVALSPAYRLRRYCFGCQDRGSEICPRPSAGLRSAAATPVSQATQSGCLAPGQSKLHLRSGETFCLGAVRLLPPAGPGREKPLPDGDRSSPDEYTNRLFRALPNINVRSPNTIVRWLAEKRHRGRPAAELNTGYLVSCQCRSDQSYWPERTGYFWHMTCIT